MARNGKGPGDRHNPEGPTTKITANKTSTTQAVHKPAALIGGQPELLELILEAGALAQEDRLLGADMHAQRIVDGFEQAALRILDERDRAQRQGVAS